MDPLQTTESSRTGVLTVAAPSSKPIALRVTRRAERELRGGFPWVFEAAITDQSRAGSAGDLAIVFDRKGRFLAVGLYDPHASIRVRVLQHSDPASIGAAWYAGRLRQAVERRASLWKRPARTTGYRLVHGENDGLPGLVVDWYEGTAVVKVYSAAWVPHLPDVLGALLDVQGPERVVLRFGRVVGNHPDDLCGLSDGQVVVGPPLVGPVLFWENGLHFEADLILGHKTGFYFDQRENRARVETVAGGMRVLNVFAYTGGFSVYAARGGAQRVVSVDISAPALEAAKRNVARNRGTAGTAPTDHDVVVGDAFEVLHQMGRAGRQFDMVIVDPPAFARRRSQVDRALAAYARLTRLSLAVLRSDGILVQASCSAPVTADSFFGVVNGAAERAGRTLAELARTGHAVDHPVTFRDGAYLKCLFATAP